jgi:hypothetical protein
VHTYGEINTPFHPQRTIHALSAKMGGLSEHEPLGYRVVGELEFEFLTAFGPQTCLVKLTLTVSKPDEKAFTRFVTCGSNKQVSRTLAQLMLCLLSLGMRILSNWSPRNRLNDVDRTRAGPLLVNAKSALPSSKIRSF